jgi:hypothetical protein
VPGEDRRDQPLSLRGQADGHEATVVRPADLGHEPATDQVGHDHRRVAVAAQELLPEVPLAQRPVVQERLQHAELADGQASLAHHAAHPRRDRLGGPHELDVGVEGRRLRGRARVAGGHSSNLNGI